MALDHDTKLSFTEAKEIARANHEDLPERLVDHALVTAMEMMYDTIASIPGRTWSWRYVLIDTSDILALAYRRRRSLMA